MEEKIGALWSKRSSKGLEYLSGTIGGKKVVVFKNERKTKDTQPDWNVYPQQSREELPPKEEEDLPF